ncbi:Amino acid transporter OS=Streptomyces antimycoticus OX=68175 GN=SANT12839_089820 PE=4 SV=1 [Streptomyces antimycoticus]
MLTDSDAYTSTRRPAHTNLSGRLGTGAIVFMVIAAAAPLTVVGGNVPLAIAGGPGAGAPVGFALASMVLLVFAVGFVTMTPHVPQAGAFYAYATRGLGDRVGVGTAAVALVAYTAIQVGVYGYLGWAVNDVLHTFGGPTLPWWVWALAALGIVALLGYRHIDLSSKVLGVALVLEIVVVLVLDAGIFARGGAHGVDVESFTPHAAFSGPLGVAVLFAITGFIGFEATAVFRDEARDPERTIPRATYLAVLIIGAFYTLSCWALVLAAGTEDAPAVAQKTLDSQGNMLMDTAQVYVGTALRDVMQVLLLSSLFACVLSFHNVIARYTFTLARQDLLPAPAGRRPPAPPLPVRLLGRPDRHRAASSIGLVSRAAIGLDPLSRVSSAPRGLATVGRSLLLLMHVRRRGRLLRAHARLSAGDPRRPAVRDRS